MSTRFYLHFLKNYGNNFDQYCYTSLQRPETWLLKELDLKENVKQIIFSMIQKGTATGNWKKSEQQESGNGDLETAT